MKMTIETKMLKPIKELNFDELKEIILNIAKSKELSDVTLNYILNYMCMMKLLWQASG